MKYVTELVSFALAAVFFIYAGASPALEGRPVHRGFLGLAAVAVLLFVALWVKARRPGGR